MNNFKTERRAVYATASIFTEFNWIFREQPIGDVGLDALIEIPLSENNEVKYLGLQIKGGKEVFYKKKNSLTFYFSERHCLYWQSINKMFPVIIILQDSSNNILYWEQFSDNKIKSTNKRWKIDIPIKNILDKEAKNKFLQILKASKPSLQEVGIFVELEPLKKELNFEYHLDPNNQLCLTIRTHEESYTLNLLYIPSIKHWDKTKLCLTWESNFHYSTIDFENYIKTEYEIFAKKNLSNPLNNLIIKSKEIIKGGISTISEYLFDYNNENLGLPKYKEFIAAFESYSLLKKADYIVEVVDHTIILHTKEKAFEMDSYEGKTAYIKDLIDNKHYDAIVITTDETAWMGIYETEYIEKSVFIPIVLREWNLYWDQLYERIEKEVGHTEHLDKHKERSLLELNNFFQLYNDTNNIIQLAYDFDKYILFPISVIAMLSIFNEDACYMEYCEFEFFSEESCWEMASEADEDPFGSSIFIKQYEGDTLFGLMY
jgi:hypothetical protein